jgi:hypothetical protein
MVTATHGQGASTGGDSGIGGSNGGTIGAYQPVMVDALAADYRAQLQRYAQLLAARDAEAAALRLQAGELKRQLASAE